MEDGKAAQPPPGGGPDREALAAGEPLEVVADVDPALVHLPHKTGVQ